MLNVFPRRYAKAVKPIEDKDIHSEGDAIFLFHPKLFTDEGLTIAWERALKLQDDIKDRKVNTESKPAMDCELGQFIQLSPIAYCGPKIFTHNKMNPLVQIAAYLNFIVDESQDRRLNFYRNRINHFRYQRFKEFKIVMNDVVDSYNRCNRLWLKPGSHHEVEVHPMFTIKKKPGKKRRV